MPITLRTRNRQAASPHVRARHGATRKGGDGGLSWWRAWREWHVEDWPRMRCNIVVAVFALLWVGIWGRAWYLQMMKGPHLAAQARRQHTTTELVTGRRGVIYDRNGQILAQSVQSYSIYAKPHDIEDKVRAAEVLGALLGREPQPLYEELASARRNFIWIQRKVDDYTAEELRKADIQGLGLAKEYDRVYPLKHMAGQVLGFVNVDDRGCAGLEFTLDGRLASLSTRQVVQRDAQGRRFYLHEEGVADPKGQDVTLTLDVRLQYVAEEAVREAGQATSSRWAGALVVDVSNGDILAWAQYPFFNPNTLRERTVPALYRNRLAQDALEPGSTFKPFPMAIALQERKVTPDTLINCEKGKWETKRFTIRDTASHGILPATKVLRYSSNIGMAKIGQHLGAPVMYKYLSALGFGTRTSVPVLESRGILRRLRDWSEVDVMATAFGQSISVTGLQMAQAYLVLLNRGLFRPLRILKENVAVHEPRERIFSDSTARTVMKMMRDVVQEDDGTGKRARIDGIDVGGKTGTAQKADHRAGTYGHKHLASFVGFFPVNRPQYLILVLIDEPSSNQYGGVVAAPVFKEIAFRTMAFMGGGNEQNKERAERPAASGRQRGFKLAGMEPLATTPDLVPARKSLQKSLELPGHLAKASDCVPDVEGKTVRNAVELFARAGIVPELKGSGTRVVRQSPRPGTAWKEAGKDAEYILWLTEL
ncbi:MAG: PASTA domain-containing protein [Desulfovibrio sp.]|nr:PASTA domain-containing protein [Desulfovibrio sp.]